MRLHFTDTQLSTIGKLPFVQREGEYEDALSAIDSVELPDFNYEQASAELKEIRAVLSGDLDWRVYRGNCLGVGQRKIHTALVPYAIKQKLGRVYKITMTGLKDLMRYIHCWRYHGVTMAGLDSALVDFAIPDEVPFNIFKAAIDAMWLEPGDNERVIFQNGDGTPVSIYNTQIVSLTSLSVSDAVKESVSLSAYETMCCHILTSMIDVPRSVALLGMDEDSCFILDTTGRNGADIGSVFTNLVFPRRYFSRIIKFTGEVVLLEDKLI